MNRKSFYLVQAEGMRNTKNTNSTMEAFNTIKKPTLTGTSTSG